MLEGEDGRDIMNMASNVEGQTRRAKVQFGGTGCARSPTPARFLPLLSLLKPKLALKASQRTIRSISFLFQTSLSVNLGSEGSRMGESTIVLWQETKRFGSLVNV